MPLVQEAGVQQAGQCLAGVGQEQMHVYSPCPALGFDQVSY